MSSPMTAIAEKCCFTKLIFTRQVRSGWCSFMVRGSSSIWFNQIKAYRQHFNLLLIDLRGHGKSISYSETGLPIAIRLRL